MTINLADNDPRDSYTVVNGNSQTVFTMSFEIFDDEDLNVYVDGTLQTLTTDYKVSDSASNANAGHTSGTTGHVHFTSAVTASGSDKIVVLTRDIEHKRTTDFPASGAFQINSLNTELDKLIAIAADLDDEISRSLRLTDYDTSVSLVLPDVNSRKGTVLAFDSTTGAVVAGPQTGNINTIASIATDIATLADIEDGTIATDSISDLAAISTDVTAVAGITGNVTTVAGISSDVTTVAGDQADIGTVASNIADVSTVATNIADVVTVANDLNEAISEIETAADDLNEAVSEIDTVAQNIANVNAVGLIDSDVTTVAGISANVTTVAGISANTTTVAGISSDVTTVAGISANTTTVAGISANVTTVAGISSDVTTVAGDSADISTVAGISSDVTTVAGISANVTTVANNLTDINSFANTYFISATTPSSPTEGDLWFDTTNDIMKVYDGVGFVNAGSSVNGTSQRVVYTATAGQTTFAATYDAGYVDVYLNGVKLIAGTDFTATDGANVVLSSGAALNDTVDIVAYGTFNVAVTDISQDTTPTLGGNLDVGSNSIVSSSNADINVTPNGTGNVLLGNYEFDVDQTVGASQDDYVLTYDNSTGHISLEAAGAGGAGYFQGENGVTGDATNGKGDIFRVHEQTLNTNTTIASGDNAGCFFSLTVATGVTLTVNGNMVIA